MQQSSKVSGGSKFNVKQRRINYYFSVYFELKFRNGATENSEALTVLPTLGRSGYLSIISSLSDANPSEAFDLSYIYNISIITHVLLYYCIPLQTSNTRNSRIVWKCLFTLPVLSLIYFLTLPYEDVIMVKWMEGGRDKCHPHYPLPFGSKANINCQRIFKMEIYSADIDLCA